MDRLAGGMWTEGERMRAVQEIQKSLPIWLQLLVQV